MEAEASVGALFDSFFPDDEEVDTSYYVFVEPLVTSPISFSVDPSVWFDRDWKAQVVDPAVVEAALERTKTYLASKGFGVELGEAIHRG